jgi:hypothetical protein
MSVDADNFPSVVAKLQAILAPRATILAIQRTEFAVARAWLVEQSYGIDALRSGRAGMLLLVFSHSLKNLRERVEQVELMMPDIDDMLAEQHDEVGLHEARARVCAGQRSGTAREGEQVGARRRHGGVGAQARTGPRVNDSAIRPLSGYACRIGTRHSHPPSRVANAAAESATRGPSPWQYRALALGAAVTTQGTQLRLSRLKRIQGVTGPNRRATRTV